VLINYHNKSFRPTSSSENSDTTSDTVFLYKQNGRILTSHYTGKHIIEGHLIGLVDANGVISMRYHHINTDGELMTGICTSTPEIDDNGKIKLHERWEWTSGNQSKGYSILEEI